jgi:hypothetical protein
VYAIQSRMMSEAHHAFQWPSAERLRQPNLFRHQTAKAQPIEKIATVVAANKVSLPEKIETVVASKNVSLPEKLAPVVASKTVALPEKMATVMAAKKVAFKLPETYVR